MTVFSRDKDAIEKRLRVLALSGESATIVYHGGSQPGTKRRIVPISVSGGRLRARDIASGEAKTFMLDKIEIVAEDHPAIDYVKTPVVKNIATSLIEVLKKDIEALEGLGWDVRLTEESIKLYVRSKDGTMPLEATVGLRCNYDEVITVTLDGAGSSRELSTDRPWCVFDPDYQQTLVDAEPEAGRSYKNLTYAMRVFFEQARRHAPGR